MRARQAGVGLTLFAVVILVAVAAFAAIVLLGRTSNDAQRTEVARQHFANADAALVSFVALNQRLPCPADPTLDTGVEVGAGATCTFPAGTLPWNTLGMSRDDSLDPWGWKISYRVYTGNAGSLTQAGGASMVNCDTVELAPTALTAHVGNSGGLCQATLDTPPTAYTLAGKGLSITDFGTLHTDAAYVLVSHGPSGLGAYTSSGTRKSLPASASELANTQPTGPFVAMAASTGLAPEDPNHFDDVLDYLSLSDLITRANLGARDWPDAAPLPPVVGYTMNSATLTTALGHTVAVGDTGANRIDFGSGADRARVRGFQSGVATDITFNTSGGDPSLGVAGGGVPLLSSVNSDKLRIDFSQDVFKLGVALADFGINAGTTERVQFVFSRGTGPGATTVTIVKSGCHADGGVATFSINPGTDFERVEISPLSALPSGVTQTGLADFQVCGSAAGSCVSTLATASTACP